MLRASLLLLLAVACLVLATHLRANAPSSLFDRGTTLFPSPQKVEFNGGDFEFGSGWRLELGKRVKSDDVEVESLKAGLERRDGIKLETRGRGKAIALEIQPGSVKIGQATVLNISFINPETAKLLHRILGSTMETSRLFAKYNTQRQGI